MVNRSIVQASSWVTVPGRIRPGHQAMPGSRMPPSHVEPLPSRNGPADPPASPWISHGPLSLVKKTSVLLVEPLAAERVEHLADAPVEFLDHVAVQPAAALAGRTCSEANSGTCGKVCGEVEEERAVLVVADELHRPPRCSGG